MLRVGDLKLVNAIQTVDDGCGENNPNVLPRLVNFTHWGA